MTRKKQIAERIKTMRMSRGMSQQDLANALHCGQSTIAMYETGKRMPDPNTIDYLADIFNVPAYSIMYSEDEMMPRFSSINEMDGLSESRERSGGEGPAILSSVEWGSRGRRFKSSHPDQRKALKTKCFQGFSLCLRGKLQTGKIR